MNLKWTPRAYTAIEHKCAVTYIHVHALQHHQIYSPWDIPVVEQTLEEGTIRHSGADPDALRSADHDAAAAQGCPVQQMSGALPMHGWRPAGWTAVSFEALDVAVHATHLLAEVVCC